MVEEQQDVQEVVTPQTTDTPNSEEQQETSAEQDQSQRPSDNDQERNWRALRDSQKDLRRQNEELAHQNKELVSAFKEYLGKDSTQAEPEEKWSDDDILTFGQTKKAIRQDAEKIAKEIVAQTLAEREQLDAPNRLKAEFSDFDDVVSKENVDYLIKNEPELANILRDTTDQYKQGKVAYKFIKSLGVDNQKNTESLKREASTNASKPVSPNAVIGRSSLDDANVFSKGLTPDLKKMLHQEMMDSIKKS